MGVQGEEDDSSNEEIYYNTLLMRKTITMININVNNAMGGPTGEWFQKNYISPAGFVMINPIAG